MSLEYKEDLTWEIISAAIEVHSILGPGLLEKLYQKALMIELSLRGIPAQEEVAIPVIYKGQKLETEFRADIIVNDEIILELKATDHNHPVFAKQLLTYLKVTGKPLGLLMNFNRIKLVDGLKRIINT